ncbi:TolC family protein [Breznakiella homolactica]|uniref:TolC family protein n=1 Tax=Breznakiella homolactica TaxID=2798577 RepID=A0A7T7XLU4_9SPIR|nr:TolC family protein [Breznakiella homolactica]QQO08680.1 TolC family protein [Breznakiella homolactica]
MKHNRVLIVCITIMVCAGTLSAETNLTVDEAVQLALENNLSLERTKVDMEGKKRASDRSWNNLIPSVTASGSVSHGTALVGDLSAGRDEWSSGGSLSASWSLSPAIVSGIKQTKTDYESGIITYEEAKQNLELQVRKAFYQILLYRANTDLIGQSIETAQSRYEQAYRSAQAGQVPKLDELSARVDLENLKPSLRSAEAQYMNAMDSFKQILGLPADTDISLTGTLDNDSGTIQVTGIRNVNESYSVSSLRKSLELLEAQKSTAWNQAYMPSLNLSWNTTPTYGSSSKEWTDNGSFSVALSFKLDNYLPWSSAREQIDSYNDSITNYQSQITEALMNSENQIRQHQRSIEQSLESIDSLRLNVELAEETYAMYEESYAKGTADLQSLRSAYDSLSEAKHNVQQEYYNLLSVSLDLEKELNVPFGTLWQ